ncbi:SDR family oxidoreductase [Corynebacterium sp. H113]|uniref:SDR family oxidoreductase n=1 Tax=Corynebacterium sp. H113 TaxID=3133419 RepID=UPI0030A81525
MFSLNNRTAIVTGGSAGIGLGIATQLSEAGANVVIAALDDDNLAAAASALPNALVLACDVTSLADCKEVVTKAVEKFGSVDIVVANAGAFPQKAIEEIDSEVIGKLTELNVGGMANIVSVALPELKKSEAGRVIATSSITGPFTGYPGWAHYGATKAAQMGYVRTAAIELAKYGITVNAVLPGNIVTGGLEGLSQEYLDTMSAAVPGGKLGEPADIGNAVVFLASKEAKYINGHGIVVDGGQILPESADAL